jgi:hypothetical protein
VIKHDCSNLEPPASSSPGKSISSEDLNIKKMKKIYVPVARFEPYPLLGSPVIITLNQREIVDTANGTHYLKFSFMFIPFSFNFIISIDM